MQALRRMTRTGTIMTLVAATAIFMVISIGCNGKEPIPVKRSDDKQGEMQERLDRMSGEIASLKETVEEIQDTDEESSPPTRPESSETSDPALPARSAAGFADCIVNTMSAVLSEQEIIWYELEWLENRIGVNPRRFAGNVGLGYAARACRHLAPVARPLWIKKGCMEQAVIYFNKRHPYYLPDGVGSYHNPNPHREGDNDYLDGIFALEVCRPGQ